MFGSDSKLGFKRNDEKGKGRKGKERKERVKKGQCTLFV
jgi:hypothetical protein